MPSEFAVDRLVFTPDDVDLDRSPLAGRLGAETYVLGAFNPGLTRLANGNLLMMVRVAQALREPIGDGHVRAIRWEAGAYHVVRREHQAIHGELTGHAAIHFERGRRRSADCWAGCRC